MQSRTATLACGLNVRWLEAGSGPCALMLHGFPELAHSWRFQLAGLSDRWRVVAPDMRGYGQTDAPVGWRHYTFSRLIADVGELIDAIGERRVHLVGHDWGGAIAWEAAARLGDRIASVAVCNCPHPRVMLRELLIHPPQALRSWYMCIFQLPRVPERMMARDPERRMPALFRSTATNRAPFDDASLAPYVEQARRGFTGGLNYYRAAFRSPPLPRRKVEVPALLIWGDDDRFLGPRLARAEAYRGIVRQLRVVRVPGSGHWVQQEAAETVNRLLAEHFEAHA